MLSLICLPRQTAVLLMMSQLEKQDDVCYIIIKADLNRLKLTSSKWT